jgi:hypothetical protein
LYGDSVVVDRRRNTVGGVCRTVAEEDDRKNGCAAVGVVRREVHRTRASKSLSDYNEVISAEIPDFVFFPQKD